MIDLTPLDVRKKRGDFRKQMRGYDPDEVNHFLDLVAERLEELVKENLTLRERSDRLQDQVASQQGREKAVQDALVTAQQLRDDIRGQAQREAEDIRSRAEREAEDLRVHADQETRLARREAEAEARRVLGEAERRVEEQQKAVEELERQRVRFLKGFRQLLQRELDMLEVEEARTPLDDVTVELDLGGRRRGGGGRSDPGGRDRKSERQTTPAVEEVPVDPDAPVHELARSSGEGDAGTVDEEPAAAVEEPSFEAGEEGDGADGAPVQGGSRAPGMPRAWREGAGSSDEPELWLSSILDEEEVEGDEEPPE